MSIVDFTIHTKPELPENERTELEIEIREMDGVMAACFSSSHPNMMEVAYDPDVVTSSVVMECVSQRGISAKKVGL